MKALSDLKRSKTAISKRVNIPFRTRVLNNTFKFKNSKGLKLVIFGPYTYSYPLRIRHAPNYIRQYKNVEGTCRSSLFVFEISTISCYVKHDMHKLPISNYGRNIRGMKWMAVTKIF